MEHITMDFDKFPEAVGQSRSAQLGLKIFVEDLNNDLKKRERAYLIYGWLGIYNIEIDTVFDDNCPDEWGEIILKIMETYNICEYTRDTNVITNYIDTLKLLRSKNKSR